MLSVILRIFGFRVEMPTYIEVPDNVVSRLMGVPQLFRQIPCSELGVIGGSPQIFCQFGGSASSLLLPIITRKRQSGSPTFDLSSLQDNDRVHEYMVKGSFKPYNLGHLLSAVREVKT